MGLNHEKLFYALKHSAEDFTNILERFYPDKYRRFCAALSKFPVTGLKRKIAVNGSWKVVNPETEEGTEQNQGHC